MLKDQYNRVAGKIFDLKQNVIPTKEAVKLLEAGVYNQLYLVGTDPFSSFIKLDVCYINTLKPLIHLDNFVCVKSYIYKIGIWYRIGEKESYHKVFKDWFSSVAFSLSEGNIIYSKIPFNLPDRHNLLILLEE